MEVPVFKGNCPRVVNKDAKYSVRSGPNGSVVSLIYRSLDDERWYATSEDHSELVNMVNEVKTSLGLPPNGAFYINEYKQVIVPTAHSDNYYLAGKYEKPLRFEFEGFILSGEPTNLEGQPMKPGDVWDGPHTGIPYVLCAGGKDVKYTMRPRPNVEKDVSLGKSIGVNKASEVACKIAALCGLEGGRFYVNEFLSVFKPVNGKHEVEYYYVGQIDLNSWFPEPNGSQDRLRRSLSDALRRK